MWHNKIYQLPAKCSKLCYLNLDNSLKQFSITKLIRPEFETKLHPMQIDIQKFHTNNCLTSEHKDEYIAKLALKESRSKELVSKEFFDDKSEKNRETFKNAIEIFNSRDIRKRGSVEFIYAALKHMKQFDCHRDISVYKALIDILPKGEYVPKNLWQADFGHYPKQQDCIVEVLHTMERNKVVPDQELGDILKNIFGIYSGPYRKFARMSYWMPKFRNMSPFPLPMEMPKDPIELAHFAIDRVLGSVDPLTSINLYDAGEELSEVAIDKTWIVSGISEEQRDMIKSLPKDKPLYVEGGFQVWLRDKQVTYFILRGEPALRNRSGFDPSKDSDDIAGAFKNHWMYGQGSDEVLPDANRHEQEDGSIIAVAATGTSSRDSLLSWIRFLQRDNPDLENIPILFTLHSPLGSVVPLSDSGSDDSSLTKS